MNIVAIDIETAPGHGFEAYDKAALDHHRNRITQIAWAHSNGTKGCVTSVEELNQLLAKWKAEGATFVGHNFKFDLKTLITKGAHLTPDDYTNDTMLQAVASYDKIPEEWLSKYDMKRVALNKELKKNVHRDAGQYSLKALAPYILGVEPFWEAADHDNQEYAITDATYTLDLFKAQQSLLIRQGTQPFYSTKLMPWARMILGAELHGVALDLPLMEKKEKESTELAVKFKDQLINHWSDPFEEYYKREYAQIEHEYNVMLTKALEKAKNQDKTITRYENLKRAALEKIEPFNIDSPTQLKWLLRDYYKLDVNTFEGDESTGKSVLHRLAGEGRKDIESLLEYRKHSKLGSAFFPSYKSMQWDGRLYANFNLNGTRTGRLSSNEPNLQQCPGDLHELFIAGPGKKLICYDLSNIEPVLIAYLTECPTLCDILISGRNFHDTNAKIFFDLDCPDKDIKERYKAERKVAKELGLLLLYGGGKRRIRESAQKYGFSISEYEAQSMYERFRREYKAVFDYKKDLDRRLESGEAVRNLLGRSYKIPNKDDVYMKGFNTLIQGSASDLLIEGARRAQDNYNKSGIKAKTIMFVHDEVIVEVADGQANEAEKILIGGLTNWTLSTQHGNIKVRCEGGIYDYWKK